MLTHRHSPNGLGARDENGRMVCWCGLPYDGHAAAQAERPCTPAAPCPERNDLHVLLFGECFHERPPIVMPSRDEAADAMAAVFRRYLESGTTGDRERAEAALARYETARG